MKSPPDKQPQEPLSQEKNIYDTLYDTAGRILGQVKENSKDIKETSCALFLSIITGILAGIFLGRTEETLLLIPGLIVLIPAAMGMRGSIGGALGSRLSTALHLGTIDRFSLKNNAVKSNVYAALSLSLFLSIFLAVVAKLLTSIFGLKSISLFSFIVISTLGGIIAGLALTVITFATAMLAYRRGWDLDNIQAPVITAMGDLFTIPSLLLAAHLALGFQEYNAMLSVIIVAAALLNLGYVILRKEHSAESYRSIILQSILILAFAGLLDAIAGTALESQIGILTAMPILLVLLPVFLEEGGNIGSTLASRLATKLHLGTLDVELRLGSEIKKEFFMSYFLSVIVFPVTGLLVYIFSFAFGIALIPLGKLIAIATMAGLILTTVIIIATFVISILSYKLGFDPDNATIPLVTAVADILGVLSLLGVLGAFHLL